MGPSMRPLLDHGDQPPAFLELPQEALRHALDAAIHEDHVIRPAGFGALCQGPLRHGDVHAARRLQRVGGDADEIGILFQRDHLPAQPPQHRRGIACGRRHIEDPVARLDVCELYKLREATSIHQVAPGRDLDRTIRISQRLTGARHELFARHFAHRGVNPGVGHVVGTDLGFDHVGALDRKIGHRVSQ